MEIFIPLSPSPTPHRILSSLCLFPWKLFILSCHKSQCCCPLSYMVALACPRTGSGDTAGIDLALDADFSGRSWTLTNSPPHHHPATQAGEAVSRLMLKLFLGLPREWSFACFCNPLSWWIWNHFPQVGVRRHLNGII